MKIVFYSHTSSLGNGASESLLSIVTWFSIKYECVVITPGKGTFNFELDKRNIQNKVLPFHWSSNFNNQFKSKSVKGKIKLFYSWFSRLSFNKKQGTEHLTYLKSFNPTIIYSNTSVINMGLIVAKKLNIPHIWHLREFQYLDYKLLPDFGWWYFRRVVKKSDVIITNSNALKLFYSEFVSRQKIKLVYNGIEIIKKKYNKNENLDFKFLIVGTLIEYKRHKDIILASKQLYSEGYNFRIDIVGGGKLKTKLEKLIIDLELEDFVFMHGQRPYVENFYSKANCYLMSSEVEAFGRVTVEAMLHKLPVIGRISKHSATGEILRDKIDGLYYNNSSELKLKMEYLINNRKKGIEMGISGYERAMEKFSFKSSVDKIESIILDI